MIFYVNNMAMDSKKLLDIYSKDIFEFLVFWANWAKKTINQRLSYFLQYKLNIARKDIKIYFEL